MQQSEVCFQVPTLLIELQLELAEHVIVREISSK